MKNALIITACLMCLSLGVSDTPKDDYKELVREFPTAKLLVEQGKQLDELEKQLDILEKEKDK